MRLATGVAQPAARPSAGGLGLQPDSAPGAGLPDDYSPAAALAGQPGGEDSRGADIPGGNMEPVGCGDGVVGAPQPPFHGRN